MFDKVWEWIKGHPILVALIAGALVILYLVSGSSSNAASASGGQSGPSDAAVNAAAGVQIAQIQAQAQGAQLQAGLAAANENNAANLTLASIQAQVANYQVEQAANVQIAGINAAQAVQTAGLQTQQTVALANDATQAQIASLSAATDQARIKAVVDISNAPYAVQMAQINALGPGGLASIINHAEGTKNSFVSIGGITAGRNTPPSQLGGVANAVGSLGSAIAAII
jgi:hypothetical protein